jgi:hypothetical protein
MKYFLGNPTGVTFDQIIDAGNSEHFSKLTCSIIPTINYWKNPANRITNTFFNNDFNICFEYPVKSIKGEKSSFTDVMLISSKTNVAIESKWRENTGFYCIDHKAKQKNEVQSHWIKMISNYIGKDLNLEDFKNIEYQLLHRVASACSLRNEKCIVVYQIFYERRLKKNFRKEIEKLKSLLGTEKIQFYLNPIEIQANKNYEALENEIKMLPRLDKIDKIKKVLKRKKLFHFNKEELIAL